MGNVISSIIAVLQTNYAGKILLITTQIPTLLVQGLLTLVSDEGKILMDALNMLITDIKAGKSWSESLTAAYNTFYNEEQAEGGKVAMAFLETLAQIIGEVEGQPKAG